MTISGTLRDLVQAHPEADAVLQPHELALGTMATSSQLNVSESTVAIASEVGAAAGEEAEQQPAWVALNSQEKRARQAQELAAARARATARSRTESVRVPPPAVRGCGCRS